MASNPEPADHGAGPSVAVIGGAHVRGAGGSSKHHPHPMPPVQAPPEGTHPPQPIRYAVTETGAAGTVRQEFDSLDQALAEARAHLSAEPKEGVPGLGVYIAPMTRRIL